MANYDYLTIEVKGNPTKATLEKIMKDITGADYEHLVGDTYEHIYLTYSKKNNSARIHAKSQMIAKYSDNLKEYSKKHPIIKFGVSFSFEYEDWSTVYVWNMTEGEVKLKKLINAEWGANLEDKPKGLSKIYNKAVKELKKFDKKNYKKCRIEHYPHPLQITLQDDDWKITVSKNHYWYNLESYEKLADDLPF